MYTISAKTTQLCRRCYFYNVAPAASCRHLHHNLCSKYRLFVFPSAPHRCVQQHEPSSGRFKPNAWDIFNKKCNYRSVFTNTKCHLAIPGTASSLSLIEQTEGLQWMLNVLTEPGWEGRGGYHRGAKLTVMSRRVTLQDAADKRYFHVSLTATDLSRHFTSQRLFTEPGQRATRWKIRWSLIIIVLSEPLPDCRY